MTQKRAVTLFLMGGKMARREVVEVLCDRCKRVEMVPKGEALPVSNEPYFSIHFGAQSASFTDLCKKCREALAGYFAHCTLAKKDEPQEEAATSPAARGLLSRLGSVKGGGG